MNRIHSHYENLKVARNAPPEIIKAAYRVLAQRHHPDINQSSDAARVMQMINKAYEILSDPTRRAEHDAWIRSQEEVHSYTSDTEASSQKNSSSSTADTPRTPKAATSAELESPNIWLVAFLLVIGTLAAISFLQSAPPLKVDFNASSPAIDPLINGISANHANTLVSPAVRRETAGKTPAEFEDESPLAGQCADLDINTTAGQVSCSQRHYVSADRKLNELWRALEPKVRRSLLASQRAWITEKEYKCKNMALQYEGGSIQPIVELGCLSHETEARTAFLARQLAPQ